MNYQYYVTLKGEQAGPFTIAQLQAMWSAGSINANTMFWREGLSEWEPVSKIGPLLNQDQPLQKAQTTLVSQPKTNASRNLLPVILSVAICFTLVVGYFIYKHSKGESVTSSDAATSHDRKQIRASLQGFLIDVAENEILSNQIRTLWLKEKNAREDYEKFDSKLGRPNRALGLRAEFNHLRDQYDSKSRVARVHFETASIPKTSKTHKAILDLLESYKANLNMWDSDSYEAWGTFRTPEAHLEELKRVLDEEFPNE